MIYTSSSLALSLLEMLVHITPNQIPRYAWISTEVPEIKLEKVEILPDDPASYGTAWLGRTSASVGLVVPSVIVPESNVLLNPTHTDYADLVWTVPTPLEIDPRLLRS